MKRLLLRVGALVTVVVLGVIAIAQAQRGADGPKPSAQADIAASPQGPATDESLDSRRPIAAPAIAEVNPLRSPGGSGAESPPSRLFSQSKAAAPPDGGPATGPPRRLSDPFSRGAMPIGSAAVRSASGEEPADPRFAERADSPVEPATLPGAIEPPRELTPPNLGRYAERYSAGGRLPELNLDPGMLPSDQFG